MTPTHVVTADVIQMPRKRAKQHRTRISYLSPDQLDRFLKSAKGHGVREHAMFLCAVSHGLRAQEICNLRISDLNLKQGTIHVKRLKGSLDSLQNFMRVKGNSLFDEEKALRAWLAAREPDADDYLFNSQKSTQMHRVTVHKLFRAIATSAGLPEMLRHPHTLKHTCAMLLVDSGANAFVIRQALGHRSFDSTLQYVRPSDQQASQATSQAFSKVF